jgi:osmotically-inducible protein OsmY
MGYPYGWGFGWGPFTHASSGGFERERGGHYGRGPRGYQRSDDRIEEEINDQLTRHWSLDATDVQVEVNNGEVTLLGSVQTRRDRQLAEAIADSVFGVRDIHNRLAVQKPSTGSDRAA